MTRSASRCWRREGQHSPWNTPPPTAHSPVRASPQLTAAKELLTREASRCRRHCGSLSKTTALRTRKSSRRQVRTLPGFPRSYSRSNGSKLKGEERATRSSRRSRPISGRIGGAFAGRLPFLRSAETVYAIKDIIRDQGGGSRGCWRIFPSSLYVEFLFTARSSCIN